MKSFEPSDFQRQETDEGYVYHTCVMGNGLEIQVEQLKWGWQIGIYNIDGIIIASQRQPYLVSFAGDMYYDESHKRLFKSIAEVYQRAISTRKIPVKVS